MSGTLTKISEINDLLYIPVFYAPNEDKTISTKLHNFNLIISMSKLYWFNKLFIVREKGNQNFKHQEIFMSMISDFFQRRAP